jgi:hypothetical protein
MKKYGIIGGIAVLVIAGGIYYSLSMATDTPEPLQTVQGETQQNKNTSSTASSSEKSTKTVQKPIMNTITGENVPEGFYDEVLSDGYTYNNPKPLDLSLVTPNENPNVPGHINEKDYYAHISASQLIADYPLNSFDGTHQSVKYAGATNYSHLSIHLRSKDEANYPIGKEAFTKWFQGKYGKDFVFTGEDISSNEDFNQKGIFSIIVIGGDIDELNAIVIDMKSVKIFADPEVGYLRTDFIRTEEFNKVLNELGNNAAI